MVNVRILIEGEKVQRVGYRMFLLRKAFKSGIRNLYAQNIDTDKVEVLVSDEEHKVNSFYETLEKEKPKEAIVKYVKKEPYNDKIPIPPTIDFLHLLTFEELGEGREELVKLRHEIIEKLPSKIVDTFIDTVKKAFK